MRQFEFVVTDAEGLHARPAGMLVKRASGLRSSVKLEKCSDGKTADAKRLLTIMALCAKKGDILKVMVEGEDEEQAAADLEIFFRENT